MNFGWNKGKQEAAKKPGGAKGALWLWRLVRVLGAAPPLVQIALAVGALYVLFSLMGVLARLMFWLLVLAVAALVGKMLWDALTKSKPK